MKHASRKRTDSQSQVIISKAACELKQLVYKMHQVAQIVSFYSFLKWMQTVHNLLIQTPT